MTNQFKNSFVSDMKYLGFSIKVHSPEILYPDAILGYRKPNTKEYWFLLSDAILFKIID
jgi:hypothetical protein